MRDLKPLQLDSWRASRQPGGNSNFQPVSLGSPQTKRKLPFPALNIKTSYINHHTEGWSKEGMLRVATTLENSNSNCTVCPLSVLCLIPWPGREQEGRPHSSEQLWHSRFQPLIAESMFSAHGSVRNHPVCRGSAAPWPSRCLMKAVSGPGTVQNTTAVLQAPAFCMPRRSLARGV